MLDFYKQNRYILINNRKCYTDALYQGIKESFKPMYLGGGLGRTRKTVSAKFEK
jgi:hypothetical protein